jgi:hypothetical protein
MEQTESIGDEIKRLREWIDDLQSGQYVNCVYCGHRYGPAFCSECNGSGRTDDHVNGITHCSACDGTGEGTPVALADVLKQHVAQCPDHPMSKLKKALEVIQQLCSDAPHQPTAYTITKISQQADGALADFQNLTES